MRFLNNQGYGSSKVADIELNLNGDYIPLCTILDFCSNFTVRDSKVEFFKQWRGNYDSDDLALVQFHTDVLAKNYLNPLLPYRHGGSYGIDDIIKRVGNVAKIRQSRTDNNFIAGWGLLGVSNSLNQLNCIYCLVVKKENILGVINSILKNIDIPKDILELWANKKLEQRGTDFFPKIKRKVLDYIEILKPEVSTAKYVEKFSFFKIFELPKFNTLKDKKEFVQRVYKKMQEL